MGFQLHVNANNVEDNIHYLPKQVCTLSVLFTVTHNSFSSSIIPASHFRVADQNPAILFLLDRSGSMAEDPQRIHWARIALNHAISILPEHARFGVIAGNATARVVYPDVTRIDDVSLPNATADHKQRAMNEVLNIRAEGGTEFSRWLYAAKTIFDQQTQQGGSGRFVFLVTDGYNNANDYSRSDPHRLPNLLTNLRGAYNIECRGVGGDWNQEQVREVQNIISGTQPDIIPAPQDMEHVFRSMVTRALNVAVNECKLVTWVPRGATITRMQQMTPQVIDVSSRLQQTGGTGQEWILQTGPWAEKEVRRYQVDITLPSAGAINQQKLAAKFHTVDGSGYNNSEELLTVQWTENRNLYSLFDPELAQLTGATTRRMAIVEATVLLQQGQKDDATKRLGQIHTDAVKANDMATVNIVATLVDVAPDGTARLKPDVDNTRILTASMQSTRMVQHGDEKPE